MHRPATDTIILTGTPPELLYDPSPLVKFLATLKREIELVVLLRFRRILLLCASSSDAQETYKEVQNWGESRNTHFGIFYSLKDNFSRYHITNTEDVDYLELPLDNESKRFLISPPMSPPPEWDHWDKVEDGPNKKAIQNPAELSHLLWQRLGGIGDDNEDTINVRKYQDDEELVHDITKNPEILFKDINNGVPAIVLDGVEFEYGNKPRKPIQKTAMPPTMD